MANEVVRIEVNKHLVEVLENIRANVAEDMKRKYGLNEVSVARTLSSQILAAKHKGSKSLHIKIRKTGPKTGILELL